MNIASQSALPRFIEGSYPPAILAICHSRLEPELSGPLIMAQRLSSAVPAKSDFGTAAIGIEIVSQYMQRLTADGVGYRSYKSSIWIP
jgi:hypothetical protein